MIPNKVKALILGLILGVTLLVGVGSMTAQAQGRIVSNGVVSRGPVVGFGHRGFGFRPYYWGPGWGWGYPYWGYTYVDPIAQQRESGYSDGIKRGKDDAKHGKPNAPASHKHYADSHSLTYRQAFLQGYADGYSEQTDRVR